MRINLIIHCKRFQYIYLCIGTYKIALSTFLLFFFLHLFQWLHFLCFIIRWFSHLLLTCSFLLALLTFLFFPSCFVFFFLFLCLCVCVCVFFLLCCLFVSLHNSIECSLLIYQYKGGNMYDHTTYILC